MTAHIDINTAYLNVELEHKIYMACPPGFKGRTPGEVFYLTRALCGLKQAGRQWFICLNDALKGMGFMATQADPCLYQDDSGTFLLIFVDDFLILAKDKAHIDKVVDMLKQRFTLKELGEVRNYLGVQIERTLTSGYLWHQQDKILQLLQRYNMEM